MSDILTKVLDEMFIRLNEAYISQDEKKIVQAAVKPIMAKYGMKGSLSIKNGSTLVMTLSGGKLDLLGDYMKNYKGTDKPSETPTNLSVNPYWIERDFSGKNRKFLEELVKAMKTKEWRDNSDTQTDYFDISYYIGINIGAYNKPYKLG